MIPGIAKSDQRDKQPHARRHRGIQLERNGREDQLPHAQQGEQKERDAREKHCPESRLPWNPHLQHYRVSEIRVQPHSRSQRDGIAGEPAHQETADRRRKARGRRHRRQRHSRFVQNRRIHEHDVRHCHERGEPGENFGSPIGPQFAEFEVTLQTMAHRYGFSLYPYEFLILRLLLHYLYGPTFES